MSQMRVLVADDEPLARERVVTLVRGRPDLILIGEASGGLEALDLIGALTPELVFLDIQMPELDAFEIVAALGEGPLPGFIFVTAFDEYAVRAFEVGAIDYLLKPVTPERFDAAVRRATSRIRNGERSAVDLLRLLSEHRRAPGRPRTRFVVRRGATHTFVESAAVVWIDAVDNYLQLHAGGRRHLVRGTLKDVERELDPATFLRVHRSAIVNIQCIVAIESDPTGGYRVRLSDGSVHRTSRQYAARVRALLASGRS